MGVTIRPRRATRRGILRQRLVGVLAVALVCAAVTTAAAGDVTPGPAGLSRVPGPLPTSAPDILILADVLFRGGRLPEARILLHQVTEQFPDTAWARWGELGLGFLELANGRIVAARPYYEAAAAGGFEDTASVVLALLDAQDGRTTDAAAVLDAIANDPSRRAAVQEAAALGAGYVRYWAGAYDKAALAFAAAADRFPGGPLADDALYGLGQSFLRLGDPTSAEQVFERIGEMPAQGWDDAHVRPALRRLRLKEILRATQKRYDGVPLGQADQMLIALLDVNGRVLATGSLAALAENAAHAPAGTSLGDAARSAAAALQRLRTTSHLATGARMGAAPDGGAAERGGEPAAAATVSANADGTPRARSRAETAEAGDAAGRFATAAGVAILAVLLAIAIVLAVRRTGPASTAPDEAGHRPPD